ncbi:MAG: ribosome-associated translation inhibitor RaiA [Betaproteobacteria bacterium AqS2]|uniref:Ribosome-associated translation inhibitor RaiA n=1 Tax=Candidatus Amphirhobacter heronislandensis TaxID=1732024 RepID=A0A930UE23_9GAMM|nr:ribosome-associated translation inhibitor RaiA [Betaproteobacteria bacterium AqS2]
MQIVVSGRHMSVTPALRERAAARARKACDHLAEPPPRCAVLLSTESRRHYAEFSCHYGGRDFVAKAASQRDMYRAIDAAAGKLRRQLETFRGMKASVR